MVCLCGVCTPAGGVRLSSPCVRMTMGGLCACAVAATALPWRTPSLPQRLSRAIPCMAIAIAVVAWAWLILDMAPGAGSAGMGGLYRISSLARQLLGDLERQQQLEVDEDFSAELDSS
mmetsp:Transcript_25662/g.74883  ORF Transcript_25662/g.74883 Transcript_25662/m.74883 type:complete len:118 (-) Transcript_25662:666-1019(-)